MNVGIYSWYVLWYQLYFDIRIIMTLYYDMIFNISMIMHKQIVIQLCHIINSKTQMIGINNFKIATLIPAIGSVVLISATNCSWLRCWYRSSLLSSSILKFVVVHLFSTRTLTSVIYYKPYLENPEGYFCFVFIITSEYFLSVGMLSNIVELLWYNLDVLKYNVSFHCLCGNGNINL